VTDWVTISALATAGGTLVLAVATFSSVKSANRAARVAERSLLAGLRPVLIPSREDDAAEWVRFGDAHSFTIPGHGAGIEVPENENIYMGLALRNGGSGLAVIHGWRVEVFDGAAAPEMGQPGLEEFRRQQRDLYIPGGDPGFWQGAIRERSDPAYADLRAGIERETRLLIDLLYGDYEGGQRTIARFSVALEDASDRSAEGLGHHGYRAEVVRYWNVDREQPR
jgi:hypothetical protein